MPRLLGGISARPAGQPTYIVRLNADWVFEKLKQKHNIGSLEGARESSNKQYLLCTERQIITLLHLATDDYALSPGDRARQAMLRAVIQSLQFDNGAFYGVDECPACKRTFVPSVDPSPVMPPLRDFSRRRAAKNSAKNSPYSDKGVRDQLFRLPCFDDELDPTIEKFVKRNPTSK